MILSCTSLRKLRRAERNVENARYERDSGSAEDDKTGQCTDSPECVDLRLRAMSTYLESPVGDHRILSAPYSSASGRSVPRRRDRSFANPAALIRSRSS